MQWSGYHDSMKAYVMQTLDKLNEMRNADLKEIFEQIKEKKLREWKNFYLEKTYLQLFQSWDNVFLDVSFSPKVLRELLENYNYEQFSN